MSKKNMPIRILPLAVLAIMLAGMLSAQEQAIMDRLLDSTSARFDDLSYCTLVAGGQMPESVTPEEASSWVRSQPWGFAAVTPDMPLSLAEYCHLLMQGLKVPGGFMYTLFPGPRYAFQTLKAYDCLFAGSAPDQKVAGDVALAILSEVMAWKEAHP